MAGTPWTWTGESAELTERLSCHKIRDDPNVRAVAWSVDQAKPAPGRLPWAVGLIDLVLYSWIAFSLHFNLYPAGSLGAKSNAQIGLAFLMLVEITRNLVPEAHGRRLIWLQVLITAAVGWTLQFNPRLVGILLAPLIVSSFSHLHIILAVLVAAACLGGLALLTIRPVLRGAAADKSLWPDITPVLVLILGWLAAARARERLEAGNLLERYKATSTKFVETNMRLQAYANQVEYLSAVEERNRLAREIHDTLGHLLVSMMVQIRACRSALISRPDEVRGELDVLENTVQDGLHEVREAVSALRQPRGGERGRQLWSKMAAVFAETTDMNVEVEIAEAFTDLEEEVETTVYRIVQEGLTNAYRHGQAGRVRVKVWEHEGYLVIHISDNGNGAAKIEEGFGLRGMRERVEALGGEIAYRYKLSCGFDIGAQIPLRGGGSARL